MRVADAAAAADESIDPSARKKRGPQDDNARSGWHGLLFWFGSCEPRILSIGRSYTNEGKSLN